MPSRIGRCSRVASPRTLLRLQASNCFGVQSLPRTERAARREVTLPLFPHMTDAQQDRVVEALTACL